MRRSAAPSFKVGVKRPRLSEILNTQNNQENKHSLFLNSVNNSKNHSQEFNLFQVSSQVLNSEKNEPDVIRSTADILDLIENDNSSIIDHCIKNESNNVNSCIIKDKFQKILNKNISKSNDNQTSDVKSSDIHSNSAINCLACLKENEDLLLFNVLYCKRSSKKHKVWEDDGLLLIKNCSAVLKDLTGKVIDRGLGYKLKEIESLEEGGKFFVGGKECEVQYKIPPEEIKLKYCKCTSEHESPVERELEASKMPFPKYPKYRSKFNVPVNVNTKDTKNNVDLLPENLIEHFILPSPPKEHEEAHNKENLPVTVVHVDSFIAKQLRYHQKEGISFMYKCIMGFQHEYGQGVILADEMGLGKTLQCIALVWTLLKRVPYGGLPVLKKVLIITPSSLVTNWQNEFYKWLGKTRLSIFAVTQKNTVKDYMKVPKPVLIISYEMFLRSSQLLSSVPFDLVICDEGHRIKNLNIKISNVVNCLSTNRRILLTGTPIQNDLAEFFSIVDFVNPGALGTLQYFRKTFEKPIIQSRSQECSEDEKQYGEEQSEELGAMIKLFMLRRTQEVINQYLPPKTETVVFCHPSELQIKLYKHLQNSRAVAAILSSTSYIDTSTPLVCISVLRKLCNHPFLLYKSKKTQDGSIDDSVLDHIEPIFPLDYKLLPSDSGKMETLENMLAALFSDRKSKEKVVIVSSFTKTLDILEYFCKIKCYEFLRLDGSTNTTSRQSIVDVFNYSYTKYNVFLLSSKAGGVGFNLIGASRIILYDIDWNPANDLQAMSRIWRDGQKREVYVYRLLTTGTIEEKMYQRQLSKQSLSGSVLESSSSVKLRFSREELMNIGMVELMNWTHVCGPISSENCLDPCLANAGNTITFLFQNTVNAKKEL